MYQSVRRISVRISLAILFLPLPLAHGEYLAGGTPEPPRAAVENPPTANQTQPPSLATWLNQLGSHDFQQRHAAFQYLWNLGEDALPAIREQITASNKQVAEACSTLELLLRLGITPAQNDELIELIRLAQGSSDSALYDLCDKGHWKLASEILAGNPQLIRSLKSPYAYHQMNLLVDQAVQQKDASLAWSIIRQLLPRDEALFLLEKQQPGEPLDNALDANMRAKRLLFRGQFDEALELAQNPGARLKIAISGGRWEALSEQRLVDALLGTQIPSLSNRAARAALHLIAGDPGKCQTELDTLYAEIGLQKARQSDDADASQNPGPALSQIDPNRPDFAKLINALILAGQGDQAQTILIEHKTDGAFSFCLARSDHASAFKAVGLKADLGEFDEWLKEFTKSLQAELNSGDVAKVDTFVRVSNMLSSLGFEREANSMLEQLTDLCRDGALVEQVRSRVQAYCWNRIAFALQAAQQRANLLRLVSREYDGFNRECRSEIFGYLYPEWPQAAAFLLATAPVDGFRDRQLSKWDLMESLWRLDRKAFEPESHVVLEGWFRKTLAAMATEEELSSQHAAEFITMAKQLRLPEMAFRLATGQSTGTVNWAAAAEISHDRGHTQVAAEYWNAARQRDPTQHDWLFQEIAARALSGDFETAHSLELSLAYRPLPPGSMSRSENSYRSIATKFLEQGLLPQAQEYAQASFLLTPVASSEYFWSGVALAEVLEKQKRHLASADARRAAVLPALTPAVATDRISAFTFTRFPTILSVVQKEYLQRAIGCIALGDFEAAEQSIKISEQLHPLGIELVEECYPGLVAAGKQTGADELLQRFEKRMLEHLDLWPKDATAHNNLAWMYARCNQRLPEALEHAKIATQLSPDSATLLDTLAEAHYRNGQVEAAISAAEECIHLDPREPHYREQLSRFRKQDDRQ